MPFDDASGSPGFFATFFLEWISGYVLMFIFSGVNSFYFGVSWIIEACITDLFTFFYEMDALCSKAHTTGSLDAKNWNFVRVLKGFIKMHNEIMV